MQNKTGKYFKYAIGEIVLVVIGILIALQVNYLNEQRKENNFEIEILKQIQINLQTDLIEIREDLEVIDFVNKACVDVKNHILNLDQPSDSLSISAAILRATPHFSPITSGYNLLQNRSVGIIKNDSLRDAIIYQYDMLYPYYKTYEEERGRFHALHSEPQLIEYFSMNYNVNQPLSFRGLFFEISKEDYQRLREDLKFLKLLKAITFENSLIQSRGKRVEKNTLDLINKINVELNSK
ncbi:DUF6090 family protein [Algibacter aquimarinus]